MFYVIINTFCVIFYNDIKTMLLYNSSSVKFEELLQIAQRIPKRNISVNKLDLLYIKGEIL